jgi:methoxymalonate biosynthesis acyl carrier protein
VQEIAMDIKSRVREYLSGYIKDYDLQDDDDFFALGFVNSLFAMQLVLFVEKEFDIAIDGGDMNFDNFKTVNAIADTVERKTAASSS